MIVKPFNKISECYKTFNKFYKRFNKGMNMEWIETSRGLFDFDKIGFFYTLKYHDREIWTIWAHFGGDEAMFEDNFVSEEGAKDYIRKLIQCIKNQRMIYKEL